ncbi:MAG: ATP-dependent Clp protease ATP-binding subunit ClpA [Gammaproteobacteria bacterium]|nr:MAG: ATP-dependent Clp protease ATP-binding subunit ClpA [Gammaproteobacteria bacterium]
MLSRDLEKSIQTSFELAKERQHEFVTVEHLLLALLDEPSAREALLACGADFDAMKLDLGAFLSSAIPTHNEFGAAVTQPSLAFQRVIQRAIFQVQSAGKEEVTGSNVLIAIFGEKDSQSVYFLHKQNIERLDIVEFVAHGVSKIELSDEQSSESETHKAETGKDEAESPLHHFAENLNEKARLGRIDPLIGRDEELQRLSQILCRRRKNNPLLVGESGVGKTAIVEGLAKMIQEGGVPDVLQGSTIYALDLGAVLAGTKYRGDFEKRFKQILGALDKEENAILFIDEIHMVIGAGAASGGVMDVSNLLKPRLAAGELRCIGATTYQEFRSVFEKDRALSRRFQKIDVPEPSVQETIAIVKGLKSRFESHHQVRFTHPAIKAAVTLAERHIKERFLPDKAIDVIDEAGARQQLLAPSRRKKVLGVKDIEDVVSSMARIPPKHVSLSDKERLQVLDRDLKLVVYGQDEAIDNIVTAIRLSRSGLADEGHPIGSFLFAGPTGVGKTEVATQLARILGIELIRFDMSEYMERHTVSRLIGAPPGYVGHDQSGLLTEAVYKQPHAVLLLDEIEKAHPDIHNLLLQVMDHGTLTDNNGREADFRNIVLIMTTNAGAEERHRAAIGFANRKDETDSHEAIKRMFSPEFRNRLDAIVQFSSLDRDTMLNVVDKFIIQLQAQLEEKGVEIEVTDSARNWLVEHGFDEKMGARPLSRVIRERIKKPLAESILFGELSRGGRIRVTENDDSLGFEIEGDKTELTA